MTDARDDPFAAFHPDHTVMHPTPGRAGQAGATGPGGAAAAGHAEAARPAHAPPGRDAPLSMDALMTASLNPLVAAAVPLLVAAPRLRHTAHHPNPAGLKEALAEGVRKFEAQARAQGLPHEQVIAARYILCTLLDESATRTPWGGQGAWSARSLLVQFHNETWGGEKIFQLLARLAEDVETHRHLLELLYVVLAFGLEGRYAVLDTGRAQLDGVRQRLAQLLRQGRPGVDRALSPRWRGEATPPARLREGLPTWLVALLAALLLATVLATLRWRLDDRAAPVVAALAGLDGPAAPLGATPPGPLAPAAAPRLAGFLRPEIAAGLVRVQDFADRSVVTIAGDGFFEAGSTDIAPGLRSLLPRIAQALADTPGRVLVTGHTDDRPIRTPRHPSNRQLSQDRAEAVRAELARGVDPARLQAEGRADGEPVADNAQAAGRARNRRVEITLFVTAPTRSVTRH